MRKTPRFTKEVRDSPDGGAHRHFSSGPYKGWSLLKASKGDFAFRENHYNFCLMIPSVRVLDPTKIYFRVVNNQLHYALIGPKGKRVTGVLDAEDLGLSQAIYHERIIEPANNITDLNSIKDIILEIIEKSGHMPTSDKLGEGSFGTVYKAYPINEQTSCGVVNKPYALKKIVVMQGGDKEKEAYYNARVKDEHALLSQNRYVTEPLISVPFNLFDKVVVGWSHTSTPEPNTLEIEKLLQSRRRYQIQGRWTDERGEVVVRDLSKDCPLQSLPETGQINDPELLQKLQSLYSIGTKHYIITEHVSGAPLIVGIDDGYVVNDLLKKASFEKRLDVIIQLFDQLHSFHHSRPDRALPMIHRDVKWENILFDGKSVRIIDFGLARSTEDGKFEIPDTPYCKIEGGFSVTPPEVVTNNYAELSSDDYAMTPIIAVLFGAYNPNYQKESAYSLVKDPASGGGYHVRSSPDMVLEPNDLCYRIDNRTQMFCYHVMLPSGEVKTGQVSIGELGEGITIGNISDKMKTPEGRYLIMAKQVGAPLKSRDMGAFCAQEPYIINDMLHAIYPKKYPQDLKPIIVNFVNRMQSIDPKQRPNSAESLRFFTALSHFCKAHKTSEKWFLSRSKKAALKEQMSEARVEMALVEKGIDLQRYFRQLPRKLANARRLEEIIYGKKYPAEIKTFVFEFLERMQKKDRDEACAKTEEQEKEALRGKQRNILAIESETKRLLKEKRLAEKNIKELEGLIHLMSEKGLTSMGTADRRISLENMKEDLKKEKASLSEKNKSLEQRESVVSRELSQIKSDTDLELESFFKTLNDFCKAYTVNPDLTTKGSEAAIYYLGLTLKAKDLDQAPTVKQKAIQLFHEDVIPTQERIARLIEKSKEVSDPEFEEPVSEGQLVAQVKVVTQATGQVAKPQRSPTPLEQEVQLIIAQDQNDKNIRQFTECYKRIISPTLFGLGRSDFGKQILNGDIKEFGEIENYANTSHHAAHRALQEMKGRSAARAA